MGKAQSRFNFEFFIGFPSPLKDLQLLPRWSSLHLFHKPLPLLVSERANRTRQHNSITFLVVVLDPDEDADRDNCGNHNYEMVPDRVGRNVIHPRQLAVE